MRGRVEIVLVVFAGMAILSVPGEALLRLASSSSSKLSDDAPALHLLGMATIMTLPMVAWMRYRGHEPLAPQNLAAGVGALLVSAAEEIGRK